MSAPPKTVLAVSPEEEASIRDAVRGVDVATMGFGRVAASAGHVETALDFLNDPAVSAPIYDLPRPLTRESVAAWIAVSEEERARGEGLLVFTADPQGVIHGYSKITVWPDRSAAELAGALRATLQSAGSGGAGAMATVDWIFANLKVRLMCLTAATDNVRSAKLIDRIGFVRMGERDAVRPDGTTRRSLYWEMTREAWERAKV